MMSDPGVLLPLLRAEQLLELFVNKCFERMTTVRYRLGTYRHCHLIARDNWMLFWTSNWPFDRRRLVHVRWLSGDDSQHGSLRTG